MASPRIRKTLTLSRKNLIIILRRHFLSTLIRAFLLPVIFISFISFSRFLFVPPAKYGVGTPASVINLADALAAHNNKPLVFVHNNVGSHVLQLIQTMQEQLKGNGIIKVLSGEDALKKECKQSLRGVSPCFAAVAFQKTPDNGPKWNYTLNTESSIADQLDVDNHNNGIQQYVLPVQKAVDSAIAKLEGYSGPDIGVSEYMYTDMTDKEYQDSIITGFAGTLVNYLSVVLLASMLGVIYHLTGFQATEREKGLSSLIETMGGSNMKFARMASYHFSFQMVYKPGWIIIGSAMQGGFFKNTTQLIPIAWVITSGWALTSWAIFLGSFFKKAQFSGISAAVIALLLGVIAQVSKQAGTVSVTILSALFPPMNFVFLSISLGRFEKEALGASLIKAPPTGNSKLPIIVLFGLNMVHSFVFPILATYVERFLYDTESRGHRITTPGAVAAGNAVEIQGFTKRYQPRLLSRLFGKKHESVIAVNGLNLNILEGQIMVLLGANGSGKTTTLEAVAGLGDVSEGEIRIASGGCMGICPQKNVLWDDLTVFEHTKIWNRIKCPGDDKSTLKQLINDCDLGSKRHAQSKTLSGGQKRKLQIAAMLTGGSTVCAIDEVSSGLDPISRRKIWDIILAVRGQRTILMTSHFLDEADLLADHIAVLSKGILKCDGSAVQLKSQFGGGYRVYAPIDAPDLEDVLTKRLYDHTIYHVPDPVEANRLIESLERLGISDYYVNGPTIEDVFLKVADESIATGSGNSGERLVVPDRIDQTSSMNSHLEKSPSTTGVSLHNGKHISTLQQTWVLIRKRITILQRGYLPTIVAILIPIIAAGITMVTFKGFKGVSCSPTDQTLVPKVEKLSGGDIKMALGPQNKVISAFSQYGPLLLSSIVDAPTNSTGGADLLSTVTFVDSVESLNQDISNNYKTIMPGGFFLGSNSATLAFRGTTDEYSVIGAMALLNFVDNALLNVTGGITTQYLPFDYPWANGQSETLLFIIYAGLAFAAFPAFFALYPTAERTRKVRALHYSNGVRVVPLWLAYLLFDLAAILVISAVCTIIFEAGPGSWYGSMGYVFLILVLYGIASSLFVYCISLVANSQLSAFAFAAGGQAAAFLIYFMLYMSMITFSRPENVDTNLRLTNYIASVFAPIISLVHTFFVGLNSFSISCDNDQLAPQPVALRLYGSAILYLILQSVFLFSILVLHDSGKLRINMNFRKVKPRRIDLEDTTFDEAEIAEEVRRVEASADSDGLRVQHLSKKFGSSLAVNDITFGVPRGEVFALLGPNGAGKTTTINMIRGEIPPSSGKIFVQNILVNKNRSQARSHLGVCPQFDAMDRMTVTEHLVFYARIRGVEDVDYNVNEALRAVGLEQFRFRVAEKLSGGNKRKLSLAIALMGNPAVLLLDEPSSGMDAAAKRVMWRTLESVVPGRSIVLTTHSMEECSALAKRAGIMAERMLALDTTDQLRRKYGNKYLVHVVLASAPHSSEVEIENAKQWFLSSFPGSESEPRSFGGQIRFSIPAQFHQSNTVGQVFSKLDREGRDYGLQFWSVDSATMDMVFLEVVGRANVGEEGNKKEKKTLFKKISMKMRSKK